MGTVLVMIGAALSWNAGRIAGAIDGEEDSYRGLSILVCAGVAGILLAVGLSL